MARIGVLFVCYGNICRSPMAEFVFKDLICRKGVSDRFNVASAATSGEHIGDSPDPRTAEQLRIHGISCEGKRGRRLIAPDYVDYDYIVGMDRMNLEYIRRTAPSGNACTTARLLDFCGGGDIADPYYTGDFATTYAQVVKGCEALLERIKADRPERFRCL